MKWNHFSNSPDYKLKFFIKLSIQKKENNSFSETEYQASKILLK